MSFEHGVAHISEWYENNDGQARRDFVVRDFGNYVWHVKQSAERGSIVVTENVAYQSDPNSGETNKMDISHFCNRCISPEIYQELQFTHACQCCNFKW
jgi:hypothetical protein